MEGWREKLNERGVREMSVISMKCSSVLYILICDSTLKDVSVVISLCFNGTMEG